MRFVSYIIEFVKRGVILLYGVIAGKHTYLPGLELLPLIEADSVNFYADTPNTIIRFKSKDQTGYFRECRRHLQSKEFLRELFDDYCQYVYVNSNSKACSVLLNAFIDTSYKWKRFYKMGEGTARFSRITKYRRTGDYHILGFNDGLPEWFYNQLLQLVQFAWGPIMEYRYCWCLQEGRYQTFNSSKSYVTKLVADCYGVGDLIPRTYYAKLKFDGKIRVGVVVEPASGDDPVLLANKLAREEIHPFLQRNLISLWIIDQICYQKDHRPGNYFIGKNGDLQYSLISAFDNDCPTTLFPIGSISFTTYTGILPMVNRAGKSRIPYISRGLYEDVKRMDGKKLREIISGYCSSFEVFMLERRANVMRSVLAKNLSSGHLSLLSDSDWSVETMQDEMQVSTDTYFSFFVKHYVDWDIDSSFEKGRKWQ